MILLFYTVFLIFIIYNLNNYISNTQNISAQENIAQFLLTLLVHNKLITSMQIIAAYIFLCNTNPISFYLFLPTSKIIIYHIVIFLNLFLKDVKLNEFGKLKIHTYVINLLMIFDSIKFLH